MDNQINALCKTHHINTFPVLYCSVSAPLPRRMLLIDE